MKGLRTGRGDRLLELDEVERRLKPFGRRYLGVREIPLVALVGTDSRASSFTRDFRPLHDFSRDRMRSLAGAFADGAFPLIVRNRAAAERAGDRRLARAARRQG